MRLEADGYAVLPVDKAVLAWSEEAAKRALELSQAAELKAKWLRHGGTWFVGVDALDNAPDGGIREVALNGPWETLLDTPNHWHRAQISIVYQGYPGRSPKDTEAAHRFRLRRHSAHLDGLLAVGPDGRRMLKEPHAFILGIPLNAASPEAAPLVVYERSHHVIRNAFESRFKGLSGEAQAHLDLTDIYHAARRQVFEHCPARKLPLLPGQSVLVHRMAIHGIAPWETGAWGPKEGRMMAYFRPLLSQNSDWISKP